VGRKTLGLRSFVADFSQALSAHYAGVMFLEKIMQPEVATINDLFVNYFTGKDFENNYGVQVTSLSNLNSLVTVKLSFLKNHTYCCGELTCHFKADFAQIRKRAKNLGVTLAQNLTIKFDVIIEDGALFTLGDSAQVSKGFKYTESFSENMHET